MVACACVTNCDGDGEEDGLLTNWFDGGKEVDEAEKGEKANNL